MTNLFEELGGQSAVDSVVDTFYKKVLSDSRVSHFFHSVDMNRQIDKQKAFLTMAFGGPHRYTGQDMRRGHKHLVRRGLNDHHVDVILELLADALKEHAVLEENIMKVIEIANSQRNDVLNR
jgi:hemoglobin